MNEEEQRTQPGTEGPAGRDWREAMGERYRRFTSWLSEEVDKLDRVSREQFQSAVKEIQERFPPEKRQQIADSVQKDFQELADEVRKLGTRLRRDPRVSAAGERGREILKSSASRVRDWASRMEESLGARASFEAGQEAGAGTYVCTECGEAVVLRERGDLPACTCGGTTFRPAE